MVDRFAEEEQEWRCLMEKELEGGTEVHPQDLEEDPSILMTGAMNVGIEVIMLGIVQDIKEVVGIGMYFSSIKDNNITFFFKHFYFPSNI